MPENPPPRSPTEAPGDRDPKPGTVTYLDQTLWHRLAEAETAGEFAHSWLELQTRLIGGVTGGAVFLEDPGRGSLAPAAFWPGGARDPGLGAVVERVLRERKGIVVRSDADGGGDSPDEFRFRLAYPVLSGDRVRGIAVLQITPRPQVQLQSAMRQLQWGIAWLQNWFLRTEAEPGARARRRLTAALELAAVIVEEDRFQAAATAFVTALATRLDCDRVSLGCLAGRRIRVRALSHSAQFGREMNLIRCIGMAMEESLDQRATLLHPEAGGGSPLVLQAHGQLARAHGDGAICTVPFLRREGPGFGAMTLERSGPSPFDPETVELCEAVAALAGPVLEEKRLNDRPLLVKAWERLGEEVRRLTGPRHAVAKLVAAAAVALTLFFAFASGPYRITAKTVLEGEVQRAVVAPYRGYLFEASARAGDVVRAGDTLAVLDDRDLRLEYSRWSSEREQYLLEHRRAMAGGEVAAAKILGRKVAQAEAQIALLDEQIARARISAPFDGVIVSGDLSRSLGAPVETGQVLFEVAPLDSYRVMLQVDERGIGDVRAGQTGELILTALPEARFRFRVEKVTPVSVTQEGRNFFAVEARLLDPADRLRPGMEGFGKIEIDRRRLIWIWTHGLVDWVRLWTWSWWP